jgi:hypothetical protein
MWHDSFSLFKRIPNAHDKNGLNQDSFLPNSTYGTSSKDLFIFVGQLLGINIRTKSYYEVRFPPCFYKLLSGAPLDLKDLADIVVNQYPRINVNYFNDKKALERALLNDVNDGDIIMIKGSNTFKMSTTVKMLQKLNVYQDKKTISR